MQCQPGSSGPLLCQTSAINSFLVLHMFLSDLTSSQAKTWQCGTQTPLCLRRHEYESCRLAMHAAVPYSCWL